MPVIYLCRFCNNSPLQFIPLPVIYSLRFFPPTPSPDSLELSTRSF